MKTGECNCIMQLTINENFEDIAKKKLKKADVRRIDGPGNTFPRRVESV
jgi:hypothetical protein